MKTLFVIFSFLFLIPIGWTGEDVTDLLKPAITNLKHSAKIEDIAYQCKGKDGCDTLVADMYTLASMDKDPSISECPSNCQLCQESEPCKELVGKLKSVANAKIQESDLVVKTGVSNDGTSGSKKPTPSGFKKGQ
jgi:hypothetical protein